MIMKNIYSLILMFSVMALSAQTQDQLFLYSINSGKDFIALEFFTTNETPFNKFEVLRSDGKKAKSLGEFGKRYAKGDTTIYLHTDKDVLPSTVYQYSAIPILADGKQGEPSKPVFASTKMFSNYFFSTAYAQQNTIDLGIDVKWTLSSIDNIKSVEIFRSQSVEGPFKLLTITPSTQTLFTDLTVIPDKVYFYKLRAQNFITSETFESAAFFDVGMPTSKPLQPTIQSVVQTNKGIEVKVQVSEPYLSGVRLFRKKEGEEKFEQASAAISCDSTVIIVDSAINSLAEGNYVYAAKAENAARLESDFSNQISIRAMAMQAQDFAGQLEASYDNTTVKLFWESVGFQRFKIKRNEVGGKSVWLKDNEELIGNRYTDTAVLPGKNYEYILYAVQDNGQLTNGVIALVATPKDELLSNQTLRGFASTDGVVLTWGALADNRVAKQKLYRGKGTEPATLLTTLDATEESYMDKTAKAGEIYRYYFVSTDSKGNESRWGNEIAIRVQ